MPVNPTYTFPDFSGLLEATILRESGTEKAVNLIIPLEVAQARMVSCLCCVALIRKA